MRGIAKKTLTLTKLYIVEIVNYINNQIFTSMKIPRFISGIITASVLLGMPALSLAQDFDDIYYNPAKASKPKQKKVSPIKYTPTPDYAAADTYAGTYNTMQGAARDIDEYNRRGMFALPDSTGVKTVNADTLGEFLYTHRIEAFHNPDVVTNTGDEDLINYYYNQGYQAGRQNSSQVSLYVSTYDPFWYSGFYPYNRWWRYSSWYDPYWSLSWGWGWGPGWGFGPSWSWGPAWGPSWGWGPAWGPGWCPSWGWGPAWRPGPDYGHWTPTPSPGASGTHPSAGIGAGRRPGTAGSSVSNVGGYRRPGNMGQGGTYRPGSMGQGSGIGTASRPVNGSGSVNTGHPRGRVNYGGGTTTNNRNNTSTHNNTNSNYNNRGSYNSGSSNRGSYNSGSTYRGGGGSSYGGGYRGGGGSGRGRR